MTTNVADARVLHEAASKRPATIFMVNNSANWRPSSMKAFELVAAGELGGRRVV